MEPAALSDSESTGSSDEAVPPAYRYKCTSCYNTFNSWQAMHDHNRSCSRMMRELSENLLHFIQNPPPPPRPRPRVVPPLPPPPPPPPPQPPRPLEPATTPAPPPPPPPPTYLPNNLNAATVAVAVVIPRPRPPQHGDGGFLETRYHPYRGPEIIGNAARSVGEDDDPTGRTLDLVTPLMVRLARTRRSPRPMGNPVMMPVDLELRL